MDVSMSYVSSGARSIALKSLERRKHSAKLRQRATSNSNLRYVLRMEYCNATLTHSDTIFSISISTLQILVIPRKIPYILQEAKHS